MNQSSSASSKPPVHFRYTFAFAKKSKTFDVFLHPETLQLQKELPKDPPQWTRLSYEQCTNCPLKETQSPHCPIALNLVDVIEYFRNEISCEEVDVEITTKARTCVKRTPLQFALSSLVGIYMVTSGCPVMDPLRPLAQTHLPFATLEETMSRALSLYLMTQYFRFREGKEPDWELKGMVKIYSDIQTANLGLRNRFAKSGIQDAGLNAIVHLDCYARFTNIVLLEKELLNLKPMLRLLSES